MVCVVTGFSQNRTTISSFDASTVTAGECAEGLRMAIAVEPPVTTTTSELPGPSITPGTAPSITPGTAPSNTPGTYDCYITLVELNFSTLLYLPNMS